MLYLPNGISILNLLYSGYLFSGLKVMEFMPEGPVFLDDVHAIVAYLHAHVVAEWMVACHVYFGLHLLHGEEV